MKLPVTTPITSQYKTELPISKQKIIYRPFLVKEEKVLLTALESAKDDSKTIEDRAEEIVLAIRQIMKNCLMSENVDLEKLPSIDIEHYFIELRKASNGSLITLTVNHNEENSKTCKHKIEVEIDLAKVELIRPVGHSKVIQLVDNAGLEMRYPTIESTENIQGATSVDFVFESIINSIDKIYDGDEVSNSSEFTKEQLLEWIETFTKEQFERINQFFDTMPYHYLEIECECPKCGKKEKLEMKGLLNFFM